MDRLSVIDSPRGTCQARVTRRTTLRRGGAALAAIVGHGFARDVAAEARTPPATGDGFTPVEQLALEAIVARQLAAQRVPGAVAGVWVSGRGAWPHTDGIGDLRTAAPVSSDNHFRVAGVTKTFTATVVLQLVDEGKLRLDDTLEPFVSGIPNGREITIRQVFGRTTNRARSPSGIILPGADIRTVSPRATHRSE
jgi:D-alanyl-D-alanine carboxypeptidase